MIHIASATYRPEIQVVNQNVFKNFIKQLGGELSNLSIPCNCAFFGYSAWRQPDPDYPTLSDKQVFVVRDGRVFFLKPRHLIEYDPDGVNWGDSGKGATQLAYAMLAEVLNGGFRSQRIAERFRDEFIARIPKNVNWTMDGAEVLAIALALESQGRSKFTPTPTIQQIPRLPAPAIALQSSSAEGVRKPEMEHQRSVPGQSTTRSEKQALPENEQRFLRALEAFKNAAIELTQTWDAVDEDELEESPLFEDFPFEKSFDELVSEICKWVDNFREWKETSWRAQSPPKT